VKRFSRFIWKLALVMTMGFPGSGVTVTPSLAGTFKDLVVESYSESPPIERVGRCKRGLPESNGLFDMCHCLGNDSGIEKGDEFEGSEWWLRVVLR
jgi:hypothetical protein